MIFGPIFEEALRNASLHLYDICELSVEIYRTDHNLVLYMKVGLALALVEAVGGQEIRIQEGVHPHPCL